MNPSSLSGLTVLITRPRDQADTLKHLIESAGAQALSLPLIEISALVDAGAIQNLKDKVLELDSYQALIFVSTNAVSYGGEVINTYWPQFPVGIDVIAVGPTTAKAAAECLACEVISSDSGMTSEDILTLPQLQAVREKKIGIVRGQGGRELLADTLRERGARVDYLEAYSRRRVDYESADFCARLLIAGVNVLTVSSGESLDRLKELLLHKAEIMQQLDLVAPSQRVAELALEAGFQRVHNASGADPASFVAALGELSFNQE